MDWEKEIDKQRLEFLKELTPEKMLRELLAHIHGDGGHHTEKAGLAQSVFDAEQKFDAEQNVIKSINKDNANKVLSGILEVCENDKGVLNELMRDLEELYLKLKLYAKK